MSALGEGNSSSSSYIPGRQAEVLISGKTGSCGYVCRCSMVNLGVQK